MPISLIFGDVFRDGDKEFIFLAQTNDHLYAARILSKEETEQIDDLYQKKLSLGASNKFEKITLYCYVILETRELKDRCAHLHNTGKDILGLMFDKLDLKLDRADLQHIKDEITKEKAISIELKELVKDIRI